MRILSLCVAVLLASVSSVSAQTKPNVVLIVMDDVGYGDYGSYGAPDVKTPNIDRLAREGVRFTDFYAAPTCTPTRAALITGRYQQRVNLEYPLGANGTPSGRDRGLRASGRSLPLGNHALVRDWQVATFMQFQSGRPFSVYTAETALIV